MPPLQGDGKKQAKKPTFFSHPDCTVGTGIAPVQPKRFADFTADQGISPCPEVLTQPYYRVFLFYCQRVLLY